MAELVVRSMTASDEDLAAFAECFARNGNPKDLRHLRWQFRDAPVRRTYIDVAQEPEGRIGAIYAVFPVRVEVGGRQMIGVQSLDTLTDEAHRGKGLFTKLAARTYGRCEEDGVAFVYGFPNGSSAHGFYEKLGWTRLDPVPFLVRPLRASYLLRRARVPERWLSRIPDLGLGRPRVARLRSDEEIAVVVGIDPAMAELWDRFSADIPIAVRRDTEYLEWRLARPRGGYKLLVYRREGKLLGWTAITAHDKHGGRVGYVMELLHDPAEPAVGEALASAALDELRASGAEVALAWCLDHSPNRGAYRSAGFFPLPDRLRPIELHFGVRARARPTPRSATGTTGTCRISTRTRSSRRPLASGKGLAARKIVFVLIGLGFGGAEVQVVELASVLKRRGWQPTLVALAPPEGLEVRARALGLEYLDLGLPLRSKSPRLVARLAREIRRLRPDVVHAHTLPANFVARLARPFSRVPVLVTSAHNIDEGGRARMWFYRLTDRLADLTTNVSPQAVERYVRIGAAPADRIVYVRNGIDVDRFAPDPARRARLREELGLAPDEFAWLAIGRHSPQKDYPNLLDAVAALRQREPWRVLVVGDGPLYQETSSGIRERGLSERVRLLGVRQDIPDLLRAADGFVLGSAWEGLPIVLLEAAASGLPIVATDVGGNREIVMDPAGGRLVPARDPRALAEAMASVAGRPAEERHAMGEVQRTRVTREFGMDAVAAQWISIYESLLATRARAGRAA